MANLSSSYCAICGAAFTWFPEWWSAVEDVDYLDEEGIGPVEESEFEWLRDSRVIGDCPDSPWPGNIWLGGARDQSLCWNQVPDQPDNYDIYFDQKDEPLVAWFHGPCQEIFCRYMGISASELNKHSLFESFRTFTQDTAVNKCLNVDYGVALEPMTSDWTLKPGLEYLSFNPVEVTGLDAYFEDLMHPLETAETRVRPYRTDGDAFAMLPAEIRMEVLLQLDPSTIAVVRRASPAFADLDLGAGFWKAHLETNMPWFWDFPDISSANISNVDWKRLCLALHNGTRYDASNSIKIHGLCNRRRIWEEMCPIFAKEYRKNERKRMSLGYVVPEAHYRRFTPHDVQIMMPPEESLPTEDKSLFLDCCGHSLRRQGLFTVTEFMIDFFSDIPHANLSLRIDWSVEGYLAGIYILKYGEMDASTERPRQYSVGRTDIVTIPTDDWLTGLTFTNRLVNSDDERQVVGLAVLFGKHHPRQLGETEGDKMFIYPDDDWFVMGLRMQCLSDGRICRIGLLQQPLEKASQHVRIHDTLKENQPFWARKLLWHKSLPTLDIKTAHSAVTREIIRRAHGDMHPHHVLTFGDSEEELSDITSIAVDSNMGGFEVTYGHRDSRSIGPRLQDMKRLEIDGRSGERIISISTISGILYYVCIATNKGRSLLIGTENKNIFVNLETEILNSLTPYGIVAQWVDDRLGALMLPLSSSNSSQEIDRRALAGLWRENV